MKKLDKLLMTIQLLDKVSKPMRGIMKTIDRVKSRAISAFKDIGKGMATIGITAGIATAALFPAGDVYAALGEVKSLGVGQAGLGALRQESALFAAQWGEDSATFIRSSYDIQSAIAGLSEAELPKATRAAGILAKATKANVSDMTSYFGSMYGIFQKQADAMGKSEWLEQLAGKTAAAVQIFKTTGPAMQQAFQSLGAGATNAGISLDNQLAILGTLQSSMEAGTAGTSFNAFMRGIASGADKKLGLNFTDESGKMKPTLDILAQIQGKYGDIKTVAAQGAMQKAFGDEGLKFVSALITKQGDLAKSMKQIQLQKDMGKALEMAKAMTTPWARITQGSKAMAASVGFAGLSSAIPFLDSIADGIENIVSWTFEFPHLAGAISSVIGWLLLIPVGVGAFWAVTGAVKLLRIALMPFGPLLKMVQVGLGITRFLLQLLSWGFISAAKSSWAFVTAQWGSVVATTKHAIAMGRLGISMAFASVKTKLFTASLWVQRTAILATAIAGNVLGGAMNLMKLAFLTSIPAIFAFSAALWANPLTWIAAAVIAVGVGLYFLITRWDAVTAAFRNNEWMQLVFAPLYAAIEVIDWVVQNFDKIPQWFESFKAWLGQLNPFAVIGSGLNGLIGLLNRLPGIDIKPIELNKTATLDQTISTQNENISAAVPSLAAPAANTGAEGGGGLMQQFSTMNNSRSNATHIEKIEQHNHGQPGTAQDLAYEFEMAAG